MVSLQLYTRLQAAANSTRFLSRVESAHQESIAALNKMTGSFTLAKFALYIVFSNTFPIYRITIINNEDS
jgi:hypothetical protein